MNANYVAQLRSKEQDELGPEIQREFGGAEPRRLRYRFQLIEVRAETDEEAIKIAKNEARKRGMIVLNVKKFIYRRWERVKSS